ncbi:nitrilase [bacterium]|nr:nitrilase [bacterium]
MKVCIIQNNPLFGKEEQNIEELHQLLSEAPQSELYILPELAYTGYQFIDREELAHFAQSIDEAASHFIEIAKEKDAAIVFGFPEKGEDGTLFNSSMMLYPDGKKKVYRKTHLFYRETELFDAGDSGFFITSFRGVNIGLAICFDWFFPESFRTLAKLGADLIAHSSNLVMPYCQQANFTRAIENRVYIATANRIGTEKRDGEQLTFTGGSVAVSPHGDYLATAAPDKIDTIQFDLNKKLSQNKKLNRFNTVLSDIRENFYR